MSRKIKIHAFHVLFRLFAFLADKTGGWRVFVRPKLLIGSMIIGFGLNTTGVKAKNQNASQQHKKEFPKDIKDTVQTKDYQDKVFCYVTEQMPQYPGGEVELMNYIAKNLKYPESAIQNKIQGKVIIRFLITEKGEIEKVEVVSCM